MARTGERAVFIESAEGADTSYFTDIAVEPNSEYELSAWVRTEDLKPRCGGRGAQLNIHALPDQPRTEPLTGTNDWKQVKVRFETGGADSIGINCLYGGWGHATGKAWWDDVELRQVTYEPIETELVESREGDPAKGRQIVLEHPVAACTRCHVAGEVGGPIGPALDRIASRKGRDYILESLVEPGKTIAEGYEGKISPMPPMGILLQPQELEDLMAYLMTLKE
ncbi:MAG: c-type cytochrome [Verrucomicrobiaceae bacterium]|nr:c-type cytochrome [Verrucomicrobiaceae bacterium]